MWSVKVVHCFYIFSVLFVIFEIEAKTYYFNVNKTNNEFIIYHRVNFNNSANQSNVYLSELRNNVTRRKNNAEITIQTHPLLDPEWNYNWTNITRHKLPPYIHKFYESVSDERIGHIRIMFNAIPHNTTIIQFNLSEITPQENISDVELHFYYNVDKKLFQKPIILRLYQMEKNFANKTSLINPDSHKLLNVIYVLQAETGWQIFKMTNTIQEMLKERKDLKLFITISKPNEEQFTLFDDTNKDKSRTFLISKSEPSEKQIFENNENIFQNNPCRKHDLHIDFEKLNWMKFIIAPTGYNAHSCYGRCYKNDDLPNHIKVTSFISEISRKPLCCIPTNYSPLPIMFYDKRGNIQIKKYEEMIVTSCGCR